MAASQRLPPSAQTTPSPTRSRGAPLQVSEVDGSSSSASRHTAPSPATQHARAHKLTDTHVVSDVHKTSIHATPTRGKTFADGPSSSESYSPRAAERARRNTTMRHVYGESSLLYDEGPRSRKKSDDLDYFVPIVQKQSRDLNALFQCARGVAIGGNSGHGGGSKPARTHSNRRSRAAEFDRMAL